MLLIVTVMAIVLSLPIVGIVVVSIASKREDAAFSLGSEPRSATQLLARRVVDFSSEASSLPLPKSAVHARPVMPALAIVEPLREDALDSPRRAAASGLVVPRRAAYRPAA